MPADPNRVILTGENPFIRLSQTDGGPNTTNASFWRIITCPAGPGHVLYLHSELTNNRWHIYADNIAMARWLQSTVQGMLNADTADKSIPVIDAQGTAKGGPSAPVPWPFPKAGPRPASPIDRVLAGSLHGCRPPGRGRPQSAVGSGGCGNERSSARRPCRY